MKGLQPFSIAGETLCLTPHRAIYWEKHSALLVSDCHLGKTGHFRKEGIAVPGQVYKEDLARLFHLIQFFRANRVIVVGDLFHSRDNKELDLFRKWRKDLNTVEVHLVRGNHDILEDQWYQSTDITVHEGVWTYDNLAFTHHPPQEGENFPQYLFTGHLHPSITMVGVGKQSLRLPCFYFGKQHAILPAFGRFTGTARVDVRPGDRVFAITDQQLIAVR
jgi:DNA ligase-associated metallophosphoesterase